MPFNFFLFSLTSYIVLAYDYNIVTTLKQKEEKEKENKQCGKYAQICIFTFLFGPIKCAINMIKKLFSFEMCVFLNAFF